MTAKRGVAFGRERDEPRRPGCGVEQPRHRVRIRGADRIGGMCAAIARGLVEERSLDVNAGDEAGRERIARAQRGQPCEAPAHQVDVVRDDGGEDAGDPVSLEPQAGGVQIVGRQSVAVEVDAGIAVDLEIERLSRTGFVG